jgi:hypothetical protein
MASEVTARVGTKLSGDEQKRIDRATVPRLCATPPAGAVQAQSSRAAVCPNCGCFGYDISPVGDRYVLCHCCDLVFLTA